MKRFITYLYEYEKGQKKKNTGFIRVDARKDKVFFQISIRNMKRSRGKGKLYGFFWKGDLWGVQLAEPSLDSAQMDLRIEQECDNIKESGFALDQMVGMGMLLPEGGYMASCWDDAVSEAIERGDFQTWKKELRMQERERENEANISYTEHVHHKEGRDSVDSRKEEPARTEDEQIEETYDLVIYQKMELNEIKNLPSPNWYLCNNRFLVHGFFNYGYLILKKTMEADVEKAYLGVPGIYEKPEVVMATLFGFTEFQTLPQAVSEAKMEEIVRLSPLEEEQLVQRMEWQKSKRSEVKQGSVGCWLIPLYN